jgi:hypothetical protein
MKRGTGLSLGREALARTAVERRKASASAKSGARRDPARAATPDAWSGLSMRLSALRLPFGGKLSCRSCSKPRGARKMRSARMGELVIASAAKQSRAAGVAVRPAGLLRRFAPRNDEAPLPSHLILRCERSEPRRMQARAPRPRPSRLGAARRAPQDEEVWRRDPSPGRTHHDQ